MFALNFPMKMLCKDFFFPKLFTKTILEMVKIFIYATVIHDHKIFSCRSAQAVKQGFLLLHYMPWLLRQLHSMLAQGTNFQNCQLSCHCNTTDSLIDVYYMGCLCSPGSPLVIRLQIRRKVKSVTIRATQGSLMILEIAFSLRVHLLF